MAIVVVVDNSSCHGAGLMAHISGLGLRVAGHPQLSVHLSCEPGELSQWLCYNDSTINISSGIVTITDVKISQMASAVFNNPIPLTYKCFHLVALMF